MNSAQPVYEHNLDGLALVIDGTGRSPETSQVIFNALGTISFDEASGAYRFRAFNDGRYLDTELKVTDKGYEWGYKAGPANTGLS